MFTDHWPRYEDHLMNKTSYLVNLRVVLLPKVHKKKRLNTISQTKHVIL